MIIYQTAGPIGTKLGTRLRIHLGMDIGAYTKNNLPLDTERGGAFWGLGGQNVIKSLRNAMIYREKNENKLYKNETHKLT